MASRDSQTRGLQHNFRQQHRPPTFCIALGDNMDTDINTDSGCCRTTDTDRTGLSGWLPHPDAFFNPENNKMLNTKDLEKQISSKCYFQRKFKNKFSHYIIFSEKVSFPAKSSRIVIKNQI